MASSFAIGLSSVAFTPTIASHQDGGEPPFQEMSIRVKLAALADWTTLLSLRSRVSKTPCPGGTGTFDVLNGPGIGTLSIDSLGSGTAYLTSAVPDRILPGGQRFVRLTFQVKTWTPS